MIQNNCPICGNVLLEPYGRVESDILLVGEYPREDDMKAGVPFVDEAGKVLEYEIMRAGQDMWSCRLANLWQHPINKNPDCFEYCVRALTLEMAGRKVLFMGSELTTFFLDAKVTDLAGLVVTSPLFPRSTKFVMCAPAPAYVLHSTVGEFRLALEKFITKCKEIQ